MKKKLRGKDLKPGMHVILLDAPKDCPLAKMSGVPLTVKAVELPFVVFESEREVYVGSMLIFGPAMSEPKRQTTATTVNTKKCRFKEVSDGYVNAIRRDAAPSKDFPDTL